MIMGGGGFVMFKWRILLYSEAFISSKLLYTRPTLTL